MSDARGVAVLKRRVMTPGKATSQIGRTHLVLGVTSNHMCAHMTDARLSLTVHTHAGTMRDCMVGVDDDKTVGGGRYSSRTSDVWSLQEAARWRYHG